MLTGLPPLVGPSPSLLVLGSFPSVASLDKREYYGFGRNHFWFLVASAFDESVPALWPEKTALLARHGVAVWDVVASCARPGSLDQAIRGASANPIPAFLRDHPTVERVVLNGSKAAELFFRFFLADSIRNGRAAGPAPLSPAPPLEWFPQGAGDRAVQVTRVPSSSPVPSRSFRCAEDKLAVWKAALMNSAAASQLWPVV